MKTPPSEQHNQTSRPGLTGRPEGEALETLPLLEGHPAKLSAYPADRPVIEGAAGRLDLLVERIDAPVPVGAGIDQRGWVEVELRAISEAGRRAVLGVASHPLVRACSTNQEALIYVDRGDLGSSWAAAYRLIAEANHTPGLIGQFYISATEVSGIVLDTDLSAGD